MLQSIRDRLTGPIVWFVVGLICIPFAFWGIESFRGGSQDPVVAEVGDQEITQAQFRAGFDQRYQQLQSLLGDSFRPEMIDQARFRKNVLDDMVRESVLRQYTRDEGFRAPDAVLFNYLSSVPAFQEDGKFSAQRYKDVLARQGLQPQRFERQLRESLVIDQLREAVVDTAFVTGQQARLAQRIAAQRRDVGVAVFSIAELREAVSVSEQQIADHYEQNKSRYLAPERIKLAYVELDLTSMPKADNPGEAVLKVMYDAEKDARFSSPEERRASHILISFGADKSAAKDRAEKLSEELKAGKPFADLARANSDDPGSRNQGGDLGWVRRGMMVKSFEDALFGLADGQTSEPVETEFGWHIIRLEEIRPAAIRSFEDSEVQAELLDLFRTREAEKHFQEQVEKLEQLSFENPASLEVVAEALGLPIQTTDWFTREGGAGIAAEEAVQVAAFSPEVLNDNENSKPLSVGDNRVVVVRKSEYEAPRQLPLSEVTDTVREELKTEAAKAQARNRAAELVKALEAGEAFASAAAAHGAEIRHDGPLQRREAGIDPVIIEASFRLPRPGDRPRIVETPLSSGDVAVIALRAVEEPADAELDRAAEQSGLRESIAGAEFNALLRTIEKELKVEIREEMPAPLESPVDESADS